MERIASQPAGRLAALDPRVCSRARALWIGGFCGLAVFAGTVALGADDAVLRAALLWAVVGPAVAALSAAAASRRHERLPWLLLAAAVFAYGVSASAYTVDASAAARFPSFRDLGLFGFYPLTLVGILLLVQRRLGRVRRLLWLDASMGAFTAAALGAVAIRPLLGDTLSDFTAGQLSYVVGGLLSLGFVASTALFVERAPRGLLLTLGGGVALLTVSDSVFAVRVSGGDMVPGDFETIVWPAALLALSASAWQPATGRRNAMRVGWRDVVLPLVSATACLPIAVLSAPDEDPLALVFAGGGLALVLARLSTTLVDNVGLRRVQHRASREEVVARLGRRALEGEGFPTLLAAAAAEVRDALRAESAVIALAGEGDWPVVASPGWPDGALTALELSGAERTFLSELVGAGGSATFAAEADRGNLPRQLIDLGVDSAAAAVIAAGRRPLGLLAIFGRHPVDADADDVLFLESVAHVLAEAFERERVEKQLRDRALQDPLTGLPNRAFLFERLSGVAPAGGVSLVFVDLDRFKGVNDTFGHAHGDRLLKAVAERLRRAVRSGDTVARLGGDEFAILTEALADDISLVVERVAAELSVPFEIGGEQHFVTASLGIAHSGAGRLEPGELLRDADTAMYAAKGDAGISHAVFDEQMRDDAFQTLGLERDLNHALARDELALVYQPIVSIDDGRVVGAEALLRWQHPEHGNVRPDVFIPLAERNGLIVPIGEWVLREACREAATWRRHDSFVISLNVSPRQLGSPDFVDRVADVLASTGTRPDELCIEITETALIDPSPAVASTLAELNAIGVRLALDDFGTGYSSLSHLHRFPIDVVKIDRSFVNGLPDDAASIAVVAGIAALAHAMELTIVAEGVESAEHADHLASLGCQRAQGYHYAKPLGPRALSARVGRPASRVS